tara:strand:- start:154 stop:618 length:465 start_codon:yes stop_codon:yes gene_type:complete
MSGKDEVKNKFVKDLVVGWLIIICTSVASYNLGGWYSEDNTKKELQKVINWNTKQIHSLGVASVTDSHNAELLMQILNKIEGLPVKDVPKIIPMGDIVSDDPFIEDDDVPLTFEQVFKDQREVDQSIRAFASNNLFQAETLHNILEKIKEPVDK